MTSECKCSGQVELTVPKRAAESSIRSLAVFQVIGKTRKGNGAIGQDGTIGSLWLTGDCLRGGASCGNETGLDCIGL